MCVMVRGPRECLLESYAEQAHSCQGRGADERPTLATVHLCHEKPTLANLAVSVGRLRSLRSAADPGTAAKCRDLARVAPSLIRPTPGNDVQLARASNASLCDTQLLLR
jgi:hypothetical protein